MTRTAHPAAPARPDAGKVLTHAVLRVAGILGLSQKDTARIIGVSPATLSRMAAADRTLEPDTKEGELALLFVRAFRGLDALLGGKEEDVRAWFHAANAHLGGTPADRIQTVEGLVHVAEYLDAMRGKL